MHGNGQKNEDPKRALDLYAYSAKQLLLGIHALHECGADAKVHSGEGVFKG